MNLSTPNKHVFTVALDHIPLGVMEGWENVNQTLKVIVDGEPDYIVLNFGILKLYRDLIKEKTKAILRLDGSPSYLVEDWLKASRYDLLYTVDDAIRVGASAVIINLLVGGSVEMETIITASKLAGACLERNLPLIISAVPSAQIKDYSEFEVHNFAIRLAAEIGADVVNTYFTGNFQDLKHFVSVCPAPVLLAGGGFKTDEDTIRRANLAIDAGCAGICFGRSVWQSKSPQAVMASLKSILHDSSNIKDALKLLSEKQIN
ncbi:MAG: hypothetical protein WCK35_09410 [Chloroflexota bacterium]